jgi:hypothetical protein
LIVDRDLSESFFTQHFFSNNIKNAIQTKTADYFTNAPFSYPNKSFLGESELNIRSAVKKIYQEVNSNKIILEPFEMIIDNGIKITIEKGTAKFFKNSLENFEFKFEDSGNVVISKRKEIKEVFTTSYIRRFLDDSYMIGSEN